MSTVGVMQLKTKCRELAFVGFNLYLRYELTASADTQVLNKSEEVTPPVRKSRPTLLLTRDTPTLSPLCLLDSVADDSITGRCLSHKDLLTLISKVTSLVSSSVIVMLI